jgi:hypothetical protein
MFRPRLVILKSISNIIKKKNLIYTVFTAFVSVTNLSEIGLVMLDSHVHPTEQRDNTCRSVPSLTLLIAVAGTWVPMPSCATAHLDSPADDAKFLCRTLEMQQVGILKISFLSRTDSVAFVWTQKGKVFIKTIVRAHIQFTLHRNCRYLYIL